MLSVKTPSLGVEEPTPFVEIAAHVLDMNPEHVLIVIGSVCVRMRNRPLRIIEREIIAMDGTRQVDVLRIHKIALVEQSRFHGCLGSQQHETAAQVRRIDRPRKVFVA